MSWEELARQVPLLAVAVGIGWYAFKHIPAQHDRQLNALRESHIEAHKLFERMLDRADKSSHAQTDLLTRTVESERAEKAKLLDAIKAIGGVP